LDRDDGLSVRFRRHDGLSDNAHSRRIRIILRIFRYSPAAFQARRAAFFMGGFCGSPETVKLLSASVMSARFQAYRDRYDPCDLLELPIRLW